MDRSDTEGLRQLAEMRSERPTLDEVAGLNADEVQALIHDLRVHQVELEMQNEELRRTQSVLALAKERYATLYDFAPAGYCTLDKRGIILECNTTLSRMLGAGREQLLRYPLGNYVEQEDIPVFHHMLKQGHAEHSHDIRLLGVEGKRLHTLLQMQRIEASLADGTAHWLVAISDITRIHELDLELRIKGQAIETTMEGVVITDAANRICYVNKAFETTTGYSRDEVLGKSPDLLQSGNHGKEFYRDMWRELQTNGSWRGEIWNRRASGEVYPEWLSISTIRDHRQQALYYVGVFSDITREAAVRERLHQLAYFDGITGLPNRHLFMDRLAQQLSHARRVHSGFTLLFMDLDRFKTINDTLGHTLGDLLLEEVSQRITATLRESDTVARMGGDEFMALLPDTDEIVSAHKVAQKVLDAMSQPFSLGGRQYHITTSIGISRYPDDGEDAEVLIKNADIAMYQAKDLGRNTYASYSDHHNHSLHAKADLENDLRDALNRDGLELHYQPQYNLNDGSCAGAEALLRWNHPEKGMIPPDEFIPIAEESGLIVRIGYWVLRRVARQYLAWREQGLNPGIVSINLSPHQFMQSNLVEHIRAILDETGMPPANLGIEITESAAMPNFAYSTRTLLSLQAMGITIYIDDFGSGFSSLSHLRRLSIDALKIDRQFIDEIPDNPDDVAIAQSIIAMAKSLNLKLVAEGVETQEQLDFLRQHGCDWGQGYLMGKPVPAEQFVRHLSVKSETEQ